MTDLRLHVVRVAAMLVAVVADVIGVEGVDEAVRAVVDRQAEDRHVVGVQHAMAETDALPLRDQACGAARHLLEQFQVGLLAVAASG